jgi:hypothetical protein
MRFVRCKTTSGYEAMILTPEQAFAIVCNLREWYRRPKLPGLPGKQIPKPCLVKQVSGKLPVTRAETREA